MHKPAIDEPPVEEIEECVSPVKALVHELERKIQQEEFVRALAVQASPRTFHRCELSPSRHSLRVRMTRPGEKTAVSSAETDTTQTTEVMADVGSGAQKVEHLQTILVSSCGDPQPLPRELEATQTGGVSNGGMDVNWMRPTDFSLEDGLSQAGSVLGAAESPDSVGGQLISGRGRPPRALNRQFSGATADGYFCTKGMSPPPPYCCCGCSSLVSDTSDFRVSFRTGLYMQTKVSVVSCHHSQCGCVQSSCRGQCRVTAPDRPRTALPGAWRGWGTCPRMA